MVNANGGIAGHPVDLIAKDDANDPAMALKAVKDLVENEGSSRPSGTDRQHRRSVQGLPQLEEHPRHGGQGYSSAKAGNALYFPVTAWVFTSVWMEPKR